MLYGVSWIDSEEKHRLLHVSLFQNNRIQDILDMTDTCKYQ